jgi:group I intron endonuclease
VPLPKDRIPSGIYLITNTVNGKVYVGQTVNFKARWKGHHKSLRGNRSKTPHLQHAWNKYGGVAFEFSVLERVSIVGLTKGEARELLNRKETTWIARFDSTNPEKGYNICKEGSSPLGIKHSEETRARYKERSRRLAADPEWRRKVAEATRKAAADPEYLRRRKEGIERMRSDPEWRRKMAERSADPEWQRKAVEAAKKRTANPEWRRNTAEANRKRSQSPKWQRNVAEANRRRSRRLAQDPEWRRKSAEANRRLAQDPEWRRKNAAGVKAREERRQEQKLEELLKNRTFFSIDDDENEVNDEGCVVSYEEES